MKKDQIRSLNQPEMNPVLPQLRHNNLFLLRPEENKETSPNGGNYRRIFPQGAAYGPLIPPSSSIARAVMGNAGSSNNDTGTRGSFEQKPSLSSENTVTQQRQPDRPRSNLSALMEQQQQESGERSVAKSNARGPQHRAQSSGPPGVVDEADSASGPSPLMLSSTRSSPSGHMPSRAVMLKLKSSTPPSALPSHIRPLLSQSNSQIVDSIDSSSDGKVRRCMSSKELGTLAPPSGSPYAFMLQQKELLESRMAERLKKTREECFPDRSQSTSPITVPGDSSNINSTVGGRMANETRNRRRAEHNRAVTNDLCEIVTDMFTAESKLLNPSQYGVDSIVQRAQVYKSVQRFIDALPSRYALGVDTPSEVLLHMRLVSAARADNSRAAVHIMNMENGSLWTNPSSDSKGISRRLVTIACADANGLLEYITKLLATGGSRVLDADVMLSSDNIVLDRFVVEMHGRLRLDKLANYIETFLEEAAKKKEQQHNSDPASDTGSSTSKISVTSISKNSPTGGNLYFRPLPGTPDVPTPQEIQEEVEAGVPLTELLASRNSSNTSFSLPSSTGQFQPLSRHLSLPPIAIAPTSFSSNPTKNKMRSTNSVPRFTLAKRTEPEEPNPEPSSSMRERRPLVKRQGNSNLGDGDTDDDDELSFDYVTCDAFAGSGVANRVIPLIPFEELMLIETLGMGRVSTIYRAAWQRKSANSFTAPVGIQMLALKVAMVNLETFDTSHIDELRREADIAARLQHPNICDLIGVAADSECFCLAYDFCEGGSLLSLLSDTSRYYEYLPIALDVANGMAYLHSRNVIHRDLKPSNVLLTRDHRAKISDFGMSIANTGQELTAETGTYRYMAPEVIRHESYSSNADVYSFGICLWQLITREVPFATMTPIQAAYAVAEGRRPLIPSSTPRRLQEIMEACWDQDSHKRPSFTYVAMALADYVKMAFSPANVGAQTLQIANEMLANVEGNSTVNVDFSTPVSVGPYNSFQDMSLGSSVGLEI